MNGTPIVGHGAGLRLELVQSAELQNNQREHHPGYGTVTNGNV